jgi:hypothetical protein
VSASRASFIVVACYGCGGDCWVVVVVGGDVAVVWWPLVVVAVVGALGVVFGVVFVSVVVISNSAFFELIL